MFNKILRRKSVERKEEVMEIQTVKPAFGIAIRNAFQYAAMALAVKDTYKPSHELRGGKMMFTLSQGSAPPVFKHQKGDSVLVENSLKERIRLVLVPVWDEEAYETFEIRAKFDDPHEIFQNELDFISEMF